MTRLSKDSIDCIDRYGRAADYPSVGHICLLDNPLLKKPLDLGQIKPRLLGRWGTSAGLNFVYVHLNGLINEQDLNAVYICGPGHGGPAMVANTYLERTCSEQYPDVTQDESGMKKLSKQFSFPGGIPSRAAPERRDRSTRWELGYSLAHAFRAAFDNPNLLVACVVRDGEAETGPLATAWHSNRFRNPAHDTFQRAGAERDGSLSPPSGRHRSGPQAGSHRRPHPAGDPG
jgi:xylulose-5-phosphate/fructose-6-phosphate phosphoketolase